MYVRTCDKSEFAILDISCGALNHNGKDIQEYMYSITDKSVVPVMEPGVVQFKTLSHAHVLFTFGTPCLCFCATPGFPSWSNPFVGTHNTSSFHS